MKICILHVCNHLNSGSSLTRIYILDQNQFKNKNIKKDASTKLHPNDVFKTTKLKFLKNGPANKFKNDSIVYIYLN